MKNIVELTENDFETEVIRAPSPVIVDFYAPWCGPCQVLAPLLEQLAAGLTGRLKFAKANVNEVPDLADCFEITGVPTLLLFHHGEVLDRLMGLRGISQLKTWLDRAANVTVSALPPTTP